MTKEITKSIILQEITDKFKLREFAPANFLFDETVVPVYNVEQHLEEWWQKYRTESITATGGQHYFSVAQDERWHLKRYDVVFMTGAFTIAGIYITRSNRDPSDAYIYLDLTAAQNTSYHVNTDVILNRGDTISANVDGYTTTGNLRLYIDFEKETVR